MQLTGFSVKYDKQKKTYVTTVSIKNNGNTSQELNLTFRAHDSLFNKMNQTIDRTVTVLREDELIMNYEWQPPRFGRYVLSLEAQSAAGDEPQLEFISGSLVVWSIPWDAIMLFGIILLFIVIALCYSWYMKNKFASHNGWVEYQTKPSDTLVTIAQKNNISWRRLAQVNHIKKPYSIQSKQILLVPPMKNQNTTVNKQSKSGKSESTQNQKGSRKPGEDIMPIMKNGAKKPTSITANVIPQFEQPAIEQPKKSRHVWSIVVLIIFVAGVVVVFGVWLPTLNHPQVVENNQQVENNNNLVPVDNNADMQNTEAEIMEPEAPVVEEHEPVIQIIPSDISVVVQNGSGVPGAAGTLAQLLKENEYRVLSTENADRFDYTGTTLVFDEAHQDYAAYVEDFLNANKIETTQQVTPNAQAHITIILGR